MRDTYDVVIMGAGLAGCTAATLFGRQGLRVAVVEAHRNPATFKRACTHYIQPSALPTLQRLGLDEHIEAAGGVHNSIDWWTPYGWIFDEDAQGLQPPFGYNIRRSVLDPMVREMAVNTPGVELLMGTKATGIRRNEGRVGGVVLDGAGGRLELRARLVVGADGRNSKIAEAAQVGTKTKTNARFGYFAHFTDVKLDTRASSQLWLNPPGANYVFTNDSGRVVLMIMRPKSQLDAFKADLEHNLRASFAGLDRGPDLGHANRVSDVIGMLDYPSVRRQPGLPGLALCGDAALVGDYLWGVGCGWAFQMAEWLVDATAGPLACGRDADGGIRRYAWTVKRRLWPHYSMMSDYATGRPFNKFEIALYRGASADPWVAQRFAAIGSRSASPARALSPRFLMRLRRAAKAAA